LKIETSLTAISKLKISK